MDVNCVVEALPLKEARPVTAKEFDDTPQGIAAQLQGVKMLDERENQIAFTFAAGLKSLYGNMRQIGKFVLKHQSHGTTSLNPDNLIDRKFVKQIFENKIS